MDMLSWTAGILEGEGSFLIKSGRNAPVISCHMTDLDVLERLFDTYGGSLCAVSKREEHWKDAWAWTLQGAAAANLMRDLRPLMLSRRQTKIDQVLETWELFLDQQLEYQERRAAAAEEYLTSGKSLRTLSKEYNIGYETIRQAAMLR